MTTAADPERRAAESTIADLQSPQQEHQRAEMLSSEVRRQLKALAKLSRQGSGKTASNQAAEDAKAELKPSLRQKRGQPKGITPSAETRQSAGTAATEQPVSTEANAGEADGLLARAKALSSKEIFSRRGACSSELPKRVTLKQPSPSRRLMIRMSSRHGGHVGPGVMRRGHATCTLGLMRAALRRPRIDPTR